MKTGFQPEQHEPLLQDGSCLVFSCFLFIVSFYCFFVPWMHAIYILHWIINRLYLLKQENILLEPLLPSGHHKYTGHSDPYKQKSTMLVYFQPVLSRQEAMAGPIQSPTTTVTLTILFARHINMSGVLWSQSWCWQSPGHFHSLPSSSLTAQIKLYLFNNTLGGGEVFVCFVCCFFFSEPRTSPVT